MGWAPKANKGRILPLTRLRRLASSAGSCALAAIQNMLLVSSWSSTFLAFDFLDLQTHSCIGAGPHERKLTQDAAAGSPATHLRKR